ncbi:unnamed protein product [Vitrella brassicaformis CCMP3155]|uniref:Uncharacterized protein n=2 Tax=Vitrella brassicaformis TaxID=1169539 RepID=A0A0G4E9T4_VITBC|nr:unnamed protein product [Vitrella brassicaformis CCMP3155]|eukprot:CEL92682.1 unnamed protein product [Vitrella brassicaformis CCMP3155]
MADSEPAADSGSASSGSPQPQSLLPMEVHRKTSSDSSESKKSAGKGIVTIYGSGQQEVEEYSFAETLKAFRYMEKARKEGKDIKTLLQRTLNTDFVKNSTSQVKSVIETLVEQTERLNEENEELRRQVELRHESDPHEAGELARLQQEVSSLQTQLRTARTDAAAAEAKIDGVKEQLAAQEAQASKAIDSLKSNVTALQSSLEVRDRELRDKTAMLHKQLDEKTSQVTALETQVDELRSGERGEGDTAAVAELQDLQQEVESLRTANSELRLKLQQSESKATCAEAKVEALEADLRMEREKRAQQEAETQRLIESAVEKEREHFLQKEKEMESEFQAEVRRFQLERESPKQQPITPPSKPQPPGPTGTTYTEQQIQEMLQEHQRLKREADEAADAKHQKIMALEDQLAAAHRKASRLEASLEEARRSWTEINLKVQDQQLMIESMQGGGETTGDAQTGVTASPHLAELRESLAAKDRQITDLQQQLQQHHQQQQQEQQQQEQQQRQPTPSPLPNAYQSMFDASEGGGWSGSSDDNLEMLPDSLQEVYRSLPDNTTELKKRICSLTETREKLEQEMASLKTDGSPTAGAGASSSSRSVDRQQLQQVAAERDRAIEANKQLHEQLENAKRRASTAERNLKIYIDDQQQHQQQTTNRPHTPSGLGASGGGSMAHYSRVVSGQIEEMQRLVSELTTTLAEKEDSIVNLKKVNSYLNQRVTNLENVVKSASLPPGDISPKDPSQTPRPI